MIPSSTSAFIFFSREISSRIVKSCCYLGLLLCLTAELGCKDHDNSQQLGRLKKEGPKNTIHIVATTTIIADTLNSILPDNFIVTSLMGPGVDPHLYRAKAKDLSSLQKSDLIVYNGLHLEGKLGDIFSQLSKKNKAIAMSTGIPDSNLRYIGQVTDAHRTPDPHIWFDVSLWLSATLWISNALAERFTVHRQAIIEKTNSFRKGLEKLDAWVSTQIDLIPKKQRILITAHDAFGYYGNRYGLKVVGVQGLSTSTEAGLGDLNRVVETIKRYNVPVVFIESSVNPKQLKSIQQRLASSGYQIDIGDLLYSDALGHDEKSNSYEKMLRQNTIRIVTGLLSKLKRGGESL